MRLDEKEILTSMRKALEIKPEIESGIWHSLDGEAHLTETADYIVALHSEVGLKGFHLSSDFVGFEHRDRRFLEGDVRAAVEVGSTGADSFYEFLITLARFLLYS